ncbi:MAG: ribonuclease P [Methanothrix sp.]|uniref:ribonuclease P protein component 4 n=1 Tax=Methanothrix sp. TaxID=90426 RepID=UPI00247B838A|nr:ribonuclease P [Methanothrix sp.]
MKRRQVHVLKDIARQRMERLFGLARACAGTHPERSDRYVELALRIGMRLRVRPTREMKRMFCRSCRGYLSPSQRMVRLRDGVLVIKCMRCGHISRMRYR